MKKYYNYSFYRDKTEPKIYLMEYNDEGAAPGSTEQREADVRLLFDDGIERVLEGRVQICKPNYTYKNHFEFDDVRIPAIDFLAYYLDRFSKGEFSIENAREFSEKAIKLAGYQGGGVGVSGAFRYWIERYIEKYFDSRKNPEKKWITDWLLKPGEPQAPVPEYIIEFACYIAVCYLKYGASYESVTANRIFDFVTMLGSDLPAQMKKHGSGQMPQSVLIYKDTALSCKANDAFATIKITIKEENESNYEKTLDYLTALLSEDFPRSYSLDFRSPEKNYLPVAGLPKKGVNQLFANAVRYPALHNKIKQYTQLVMKEHEWYTNFDDENCAMPGTFAVFALGLLDYDYSELVVEYLKCCDDEHQSIQAKFITAYIAKFGFTEKTMEIFVLGTKTVQNFPQNKIFKNAIDNEESLNLLLDVKKRVKKYDDMTTAEKEDRDNMSDYAWTELLYVIWGKDSMENVSKILKSASSNLRPLYEMVLRRSAAQNTG